eukprot:118578-Chlamydomonas_euryale.AAC.11
MAGQELPEPTLRAWAANYSDVVRYARRVLPGSPLYAFHTLALPRHNPQTGAAEKSYLGFANHVRQLNAAGTYAARELGMEVVDYAAVASR